MPKIIGILGSVGEIILPFLILLSVCAALFRRCDVYSCFIDGVEDGIKTVISIFPPILGILTAAAMFRQSGLLDVITNAVAPIAKKVGIPQGTIVLAFMRPVSGSGSLGILSDIISSFGANSITALTAAVMLGSTETTLYTMSVYFKNTAVTQTKQLIICALFADLVCAVLSGIICKIWFL